MPGGMMFVFVLLSSLAMGADCDLTGYRSMSEEQAQELCDYLASRDQIIVDLERQIATAPLLTGSRDGDITLSEKLDVVDAEVSQGCRYIRNRNPILELELSETRAIIAEGGPAWLRSKLADDYINDDERAQALLDEKLETLKADEAVMTAELERLEIIENAKAEIAFRQCALAELLRELSVNLVLHDNRKDDPSAYPESYLACGLTAASDADEVIRLGLQHIDCTHSGNRWNVSNCSCGEAPVADTN
ncbi:MAG: hypothetical protein ABH846_01075 [Patescibacteria group bacterium]